MRITVHPRAPGLHRSYVDLHWYRLALPLQISLSTSFFPTEQSTTDPDDGSWLTQRILNITVLIVTLRIVLHGPLFTEEECS
jgi:hypothetical protein